MVEPTSTGAWDNKIRCDGSQTSFQVFEKSDIRIKTCKKRIFFCLNKVQEVSIDELPNRRSQINGQISCCAIKQNGWMNKRVHFASTPAKECLLKKPLSRVSVHSWWRRLFPSLEKFGHLITLCHFTSYQYL